MPFLTVGTLAVSMSFLLTAGDALSLIRADKIRELVSPWVPITLLNSPGSFL